MRYISRSKYKEYILKTKCIIYKDNPYLNLMSEILRIFEPHFINRD